MAGSELFILNNEIEIAAFYTLVTRVSSGRIIADKMRFDEVCTVSYD
jgi:hypothetical protein